MSTADDFPIWTSLSQSDIDLSIIQDQRRSSVKGGVVEYRLSIIKLKAFSLAKTPILISASFDPSKV